MWSYRSVVFLLGELSSIWNEIQEGVMREYTLFAIIFAAAIPVMDRIFRPGLMKRRLFYVFLAVIFSLNCW